MPAELWVIEAPGKRDRLEAVLATMGRDAVVFATNGHFMGMPETLHPVGITKRYEEPLRGVTNSYVHERLRQLSAEVGLVVIATDADQEGSAIAWDVAMTVRDVCPRAVRVPLRSLDEESIREAFGQAGPVTAAAAAGARARAIVDRLVGAAFSKPGRLVGRVASATLAAVRSAPPQLVRVVLVVPAADGGAPFAAERAPTTADEGSVLLRAAALRPRRVAPGEAVLTGFEAPNLGGLMTGLSDEALGRWKDQRPVRSIGDSLQRLYEAGRMSYPRADAKGYGRAAVAKIRRDSCYRPPHGSEVVPHDGALLADGARVHDAPHPLGRFEVTARLPGLATDESTRILAGQAVVRALHAWPAQLPDRDDLKLAWHEAGLDDAAVEIVAQLDWKRWDGAPPPGLTAWFQPAVLPRAPDAALVEVMARQGLGRPSTWAQHAEALLTRSGGLVAPTLDGTQLELTAVGRESLAAAPQALLSPGFTRMLDAACAAPGPREGDTPWRGLVDEVLRQQPADLVAALQAVAEAPVSTIKPRPAPAARAALEMRPDE